MMAFGHGLSKLPPPEHLVGLVESLGFPAPLLFAWLAGLIEFFGGLLLAAGAFTRSSAILILLTMLVAALMVHGGDPLFPAPGESGKEFALLYAVIMVPFAAAGAGRYSGDHLLRQRL
jgi:putative oxidoreductase